MRKSQRRRCRRRADEQDLTGTSLFLQVFADIRRKGSLVRLNKSSKVLVEDGQDNMPFMPLTAHEVEIYPKLLLPFSRPHLLVDVSAAEQKLAKLIT